ncbi:MAG: metallophosphoesterase [Anaerolineales bacterium]
MDPIEEMLIAILADTHDNRTAIRKALALARGRGAAEIFHCGDLTSASVVDLFQGWTLYYVEGNMDREGREIRAAVDRLVTGSACAAELHLERDGLRIALMHGSRTDRLAEAIQSGKYDFVFHGHTHRRRDERIGRTRVVNPGALGSTAAAKYSFCILDTTSREIDFMEL